MGTFLILPHVVVALRVPWVLDGSTLAVRFSQASSCPSTLSTSTDPLLFSQLCALHHHCPGAAQHRARRRSGRAVAFRVLRGEVLLPSSSAFGQ